MINKNKLEAALVLNGFSKAKFAAYLGISTSAASKKINGKSEFTVPEVRKTAELVGKETAREIFLI